MSKWLDRFREYQEASGLVDDRENTQAGTLQASPNITDITDITDIMAAEVAWRVAVFRSQVPAKGPIPFLVARPALQAQPLGAAPYCLSCGDPLDAGRTVRCSACVRAIEMVLNEVREGVSA